MADQEHDAGQVEGPAETPSPDAEFAAALNEAADKADGVQPKGPIATDDDGASDGPGDDSAQAEDPAPASDAAPAGDDAAQADDTTKDIWANATPEQRAAFQQAQRDADLRSKSQDGRIRTLLAQLKELQQARTQPEAQKGEQGEDDKNAGDREKVDKLREDFPELAPLFDRLDTQDAKIGKYEEAAAQAQAERVEQIEKAEAEQFAVLGQEAPNYRDVLNDSRWQGWLNDQKAEYRDAIEQNGSLLVDAKGVAKVIRQFEADMAGGQPASTPAPTPTPPAPSRREKQLASGRDAGRGGAPVKGGIPDDVAGSMNYFADQADAET